MNDNLLQNVYYYDIEKCYYRLLNSCIINDKSTDTVYDKIKRNIGIGILQKNNRLLSKHLYNFTIHEISNYIKQNDIENNIIITSRDGIICTSQVKCIESVPLILKYEISTLIINYFNRLSYIQINRDGSVIVKGIRNKVYDTSFYNLFKGLNISNYRELVNGIDNIRSVYLNSDNILWFSEKLKDGLLKIKLKNTSIVITDENIKNIYHNDIDKYHYWKTLIWPFCKSALSIRSYKTYEKRWINGNK